MQGFFGRRRGVTPPTLRSAEPSPFAPAVTAVLPALEARVRAAAPLGALVRPLAWEAPAAAGRGPILPALPAPAPKGAFTPLAGASHALAPGLPAAASRGLPLPRWKTAARTVPVLPVAAPARPAAIGIGKLKPRPVRRPEAGILFGTPNRWKVEAPFAVKRHEATAWVRDLRAYRSLTPASRLSPEAIAYWLGRVAATRRLSAKGLELVGLFERLPLEEGAEKRLEFDAPRLALKYPLPSGEASLSVVAVARKKADQGLLVVRLAALPSA